MATKAPIVPPNLPTLHIYRQLLREAGYLPPAVSPHITALIRRRFHQHKSAASEVNLQTRRTKARNALRRIRAANYGDNDCMANLILRAFGRVSVRRRDLVAKFVNPQQKATDSESLAALLDNTADDLAAMSMEEGDNQIKKPGILERWDRPKLLRLLESQQRQAKKTSGVEWIGRDIASLNPNSQVPKVDTWGRPPTERLIRARQTNWWKRNVTKLMPPLGKGEWELLGHLRDGAQLTDDLWKVPKRRTPVTSLSQAAEDQLLELERYIAEPTAQIENRKVAKWRRYYGADNFNLFGNMPKGRPEVTDRWFRRKYGQVWQLTPQMEQNPNTLKYDFIWGPPKRQLAAPTERQMAVFEGVDAKASRRRK